MKLKITLFFLITLTMLVQTACSRQTGVTDTINQSSQNESTSAAVETDPTENTSAESTKDTSESFAEEKVMQEFEALTSGETIELNHIITYVDENISLVSNENASKMVQTLEDLQIANLLKFEEKFYPQEILQSFQEADLTGKDYTNPDTFSNTSVSDLIRETVNMGYKIEQAEGFYYPVIDYSKYRVFRDYVTNDIKAYIDIMATESDNVFAKDAALMISWEEVVQRALKTEAFIQEYSDSARLDAVRKLFDRYQVITLYGLNNTPLFDYETKRMNPEAKTTYETAIKEKNTSSFLVTLRNYMDIVNNSDYKLSKEIEIFRDSLTKH